MKLRILSDIHLEFGYMDLRPGGDILVLAGDIGVVAKPSYLDLVEEWAKMFEAVIYVPGNHEYYKGDIDDCHNKLYDWAPDNVYILQNGNIVINDVAFIGGTLWSSFEPNPLAALHANQVMNDFRGGITKDGEIFNAQRSEIEHVNALVHLDIMMNLIPEKKVIVTHHAPTFKSIHPRYAGDMLNYAFATDLEWMMVKYEPALWIHGHMHNSTDMQIQNTRVICNPRGYVGHELNNDFDKTLMVQV